MWATQAQAPSRSTNPHSSRSSNLFRQHLSHSNSAVWGPRAFSQQRTTKNSSSWVWTSTLSTTNSTHLSSTRRFSTIQSLRTTAHQTHTQSRHSQTSVWEHTTRWFNSSYWKLSLKFSVQARRNPDRESKASQTTRQKDWDALKAQTTLCGSDLSFQTRGAWAKCERQNRDGEKTLERNRNSEKRAVRERRETFGEVKKTLIPEETIWFVQREHEERDCGIREALVVLENQRGGVRVSREERGVESSEEKNWKQWECIRQFGDYRQEPRVNKLEL